MNTVTRISITQTIEHLVQRQPVVRVIAWPAELHDRFITAICEAYKVAQAARRARPGAALDNALQSALEALAPYWPPDPQSGDALAEVNGQRAKSTGKQGATSVAPGVLG